MYQSRLGSALATAHVPGAVTHAATGSVAAADLTGARLGGAAGSELISAAHSAFVTSMALGIRVAAGVALASAIAAVFAFAPRRPRPAVAAAAPVQPAEA